jgi:TrmH family RNA methyltransferase
MLKQGRAAADQFLVDGVQATREAVRYGGAHTLLIAEPLLAALDQWKPGTAVQLAGASQLAAPQVVAASQLAALTQLLYDAERLAIEVVSISAVADKQLSDTVTSPGVFALCTRQRPELTSVSGAKLVAICAAVRDPGNAGTIIRTADAFGADAVVFTTGSVEAENPKTVRASVGSLFHLPVVQGVSFATAVAWARGNALQVLVADADGQLLTTTRLDTPTAWVFGNEAWGFPPDVLAQADAVVSVPMFGKAESLNVAAAAAVCLFATATAQRTG